ncbi:early endosome antigen 1-like isoform X1 [Dermacentor albipictus]|uniref:early endosome antigen 1-like isoform X1 n=1 Tax=Dermacentor albipictus TaxID=60249 RepID=UPI0038FBF365
MFNINKLLTKISDAKNQSPTKPPSPSETSEANGANEASAEGFLCPSCLRAFPSADALQDHYETSHGSGLEVVCPTCRMRLGSEVELESHCARHHAVAPPDTEPAAVEQLQRELVALHASLREERSCSEELRTEVSRLHGAIVSKGDSVEAEMLRSQVRALEEGKALLTSELVLARQQLGNDLQQAHAEATQLRTQLEQLLQSQPAVVEKLSQSVQTEAESPPASTQEVCRQDAQVQALIVEPTCPVPTEGGKDDDSRAAALAALMAEKQTLQLKLEEADRRLAEAKARADKREVQQREALERSDAERQRLLQEVEASRSERASLETSLEVAKQGLAAAATRTEELESELAVERQRGDSELLARQAEVDELRTQVTQLSAVEAALRDSAHAAQAQLADYRAQVESNAEQAVRLAAQLRERESELATCREQLVTSQREAQASHEELVAGRAEKVELAQAVQALHQAKSRLADQLSALELEVGNLRNNQVALEADRTAFELEAENLRKSHTEMEASRVALETRLAELQRQCDQQASEHQQALQGLQAELARAQNKALQACSDLEAEQQRSARQEAALEALREQLASEQASRQGAQAQLDSAQGDKLELEAKLENALDERRALLDRCLRSEGEAETLRTNAADLRRRLDDSLAALHELGRENQLLQIDNAKHQGRKWADDSQVTHCTGCKKLFTVTIRKHHCRNCGNIFCNECSAKSAATASSRKPVRVCDNCYSELTK